MTLHEQVKNILIEYPETRNSDITLTIMLWKKFNGVGDTINLGRLYDLPTQDAIKRERAHIQNDLLLYLPTSLEIAKKRKINEQIWKEKMGYLIHTVDKKIINSEQSLL